MAGLIGRRLDQRAVAGDLQNPGIGELPPAGLGFAQIINDAVHLAK